MNKLRERITRMVAPLLRTFALLLVASATCRTQANLVAEWNGDLANNSVKGQCTMSRRDADSSRVTFADGKATLTKHTSDPASQGVVVNLGDYTSKKMTVVVQYSDLDRVDNGNTSLVGTTWGDTYEYLAGVDSRANTYFYEQITTTVSAQGYYSSSIVPPVKGKMVVCFSGDSTDNPGMDMYYSTYANGTYGAYSQVMYKNGPKVLNGVFHNVTIGGSIARIGSYHRPGMVVEAVQIFDSVVKFPATAYVTANSTWSALGWDVTLPNPIPDGTITYVVDVPDSAANSVTIDLEGATVNAKSIIFNVAAGKTVTLTGGKVAATSTIETTGEGTVVYDVSGVDVSGLTAGDGLNILAAATSANVNLPAVSETLQYVLQQRSDGLYISALPKDYKWNTININFTYDGNNLSTESEVGLIGVPGNKWNNYAAAASASYAGANVCDDTGAQTQALAGLNVTVSGSRGSHYASSLNSTSELRHGYIDDQDDDGKRTPTVEISGIPFNKYRVIVYHSTDTENTTFGYDTVNGKNLCYVDNVLMNGSGRTSWGNSGPSNSADPIKEGVNTLVSGIYSTKPLTVVGHRYTRGCIAAVQVVKVDEATIDTAGTYTLTGLFGSVGTTANLYVNVAENATLNIPSETTIGAIDFNIASGKTLTLTGAKLTATAGGFTVSGGGKVLIDVAGAGAVNYSAKVIDGRIYGASDIDLTSSAGGASLEIDPADGVYFNIEDVTATLSLGSNSYLTGTYVTSSKQAAFSGITLQQFYDGGYTLRGRFAGASIDKLGVEATGYNAYVTDDGEGNVTSIRYEMQAKNNELKCVAITLTPNAGGTGIDVVANGAYYAASSNEPGFAFLNDDGAKKAGVSDGTLGTAYNSSSSYCLYGLNIVGKCVKTLTLSGDETLTVGTDIASAYDTLTVTGSGTLTVSGILNVDTLVAKSGATVKLSETFGARNISIESGANVSHIGGDGSSFYWATLTGAGTLILDPGDGNSYKMSGSNTGYTGEAVIKSGTVKMGDAKSFGNIPRTSSIRVKGNAVLDANNADSDYYGENNHKNKVVLESGAKFYTSVAQANERRSAFSYLTLEGNATVDATVGRVSLAQDYNYDFTQIDLGSHTLTKIGDNDFFLSAIKIVGSGVVDVQSGSISITPSYYNSRQSIMSEGTLKIASSAYLNLVDYRNHGGVLTVKNLELDGTVTQGSSGDSYLKVTGYISGGGTTPILTLEDGATLKPKSSAGGLTVTESLTLSGTINVDLSDVDLTGMSDLAIITGSAQIDLEDDVDDFDLGSNSSNWELYSEEVSTGVYALGVRLKTIESSVAWNGAGGTWSANSFNGGTENYSNQALQTVTFADDGESATTPLAVTVSGAKTVNALNFTADNRNVTLSGDAITAATVSKSGDGVAIINNDLSVETSISVTDGVLVLNPTSAVVSDEWTESDNGTLVVYVDSGDTTTISATITATKLIKRGAGTLVLGNTANSISGGILVSEGTLKGTGNGSDTVTCFGSGAVTVEDGAAIDINNARFTNQVYIIGNGPDGNGAYINTGDDSNGAHSGGMQSSIANKLTLTGNASIGGTATIHFGGSSAIDIGTYTLTKKGTFWFPLAGTTISGSGKIIIAEGDFSNNSGANNLGGIDLEITGGTLDMAAGTSMSVKGFKSATAITANATASSSATLIVNGKIEVNGTLTIPKLQLNAGSSIEYAATGGLTVSVSLTLPSSGYVNVDVRDLALSDSGTTIMTLGTAPESIDKLSCDHAVLELSGTTIKAYPAVASVTLSDGSSTSYSTLGGAKAQATANSASYKYITILSDMSFSPESYKYKIADGVSVTPLALSDEYLTPTADDPDPETGAFTYNAVSPAATTYTWAGTQTLKLWSQPGNWTHGESVVAMRSPTTCDSVIINSDTTASAITVGDVTVRDMSIGNTVKMTAASAKTLTVTDGVELTSDSATLEIAGSLTLSADVTTSVPGKCVTFVDNGSSIIYSVVDPEAEIDGGDVYDSLANAIAAAEAGDTVNLLANASVGSVGKAITLDVGTHGLTITSANALDSITSLKGTGTLVLPSASLPTSALQTLLKNSSNWKGTLALSGLTANTATQNFKFSNYGNANSKIQLTNCAISYLDNNSSYFEGCLVLRDDSDHHAAFATGNGYSDKYNKIGELAGDGAISATSGPLQMYCFLSAPNFTGSITVVGSWDNGNNKYDGRRIVFGEPPSSMDNSSDPGSIRIKSGVQVGLGEGAAWNASYGIYISGTIIVNGNASMTSNLALEHENDNPKNLREDKYIVFYDDAKLIYKKLSTITMTGDVTLAADSTVAIAFADGVSMVDGTKLIGWSAAPDGSFVFDGTDSAVKQFGGTYGDYYMLESEETGLYIRKAVAVDNPASESPKFYSSVSAALAENDTVILIASPNETVTLPVGKTITKSPAVSDLSNLTVNPPTAEYAVQNSNNSYSVANTPVTYYWAGAAGGDWGTRSNWKVGASDGPNATRDMETTDSVAFNDGASVALGATRRVAGIAVEGTVYISAVDASYKSLETTGNITGTGTLTFVDVTLANVATAALTVAPNVNFTTDSELAATGGYGFTFNGAVGISDTIKVWNVNHTVEGTTTLNGNFTKAGGYGLTLGAVTVSASTTPTISGGSISLTGAVTIQTGATFTLPSSGVTVGAGASFVLAASDAKLVDNGSGASGKVSTSVANSIVVTTSGEGTTTYSVATTTTDTIGEVGDEETITVITPADGVTSIGLSGVSGKVAIPSTVTQISGVTAENLLLKVTYNSGSGANTAYYAILSLDGSGNVSLNGSATVNGVKVQPEPVDTAPIGVSSTTTKPTFGVKAIPGLWYALKSSSSPTGPFTTLEATKQATESTVTLDAADAVTSVKYYKISAGATATDL